MNERTPNSSAEQRLPSKTKVIGDYLHRINEVPKEIRDYAINKLNPVDANGERINDTQGNPIMARVATAKENGSYYGPVILNNDRFIVQAVGKDRLSAVIHHKNDIALQGSSLQLLDARKTMNGTNVQIHYTGEKAKAYPWQAEKNRQAESEKEAPQQPPAKQAPAKPPIKAEDFLKQAAEYAKENIKNTNQREAFLKHLGNVTERVFNKRPPEVTKSTPAPEQAKQQADTGIER
ncbi:KfrB domain-containing protein [Microvirgula aerodenitrificans]|uniref:KfrB domain-containing protein n=1 Tax=Microvirgula aerodenitrificans TaxID=57480 RepID=UPI00248ED041|nr:hypothetical protein [Microvirgula aerodenitrificans]